jgi:hypothetical protein
MAQEIQIYDIPNHLRGDTWVGINSISLSKDGIPLNLTNASVLMQFRKNVDSSVALELSTNNGGIVILNALNGVIRIPSALIDMQYGTYQYDLQVTFADGFVKTYLKGSWSIVADISHL